MGLKRFEAFVARDNNGDVYLWRRKPTKDEAKGEWVHTHRWAAWRYLTEDDLEVGLNPQWEDEEPIRVKLVFFEADTEQYAKFLIHNRQSKQDEIHTTRIPEEGD